MRKILSTLLLAALVVAPASVLAETAEVTLTAPDLGTLYNLDFGLALPDIQQVTVTAEGYGGFVCKSFSSPGSEYSEDYPWNLTVGLQDASGLVWQAACTESPEPRLDYLFEQVLTLQASADWTFLSDGAAPLQLEAVNYAPESDFPQITACGYAYLTVTTLTVTVTYGDVSPAERAGLDAVKALYR